MGEPQMKMARDDDYKFLQIVDAMASINQKVNLIGVVLETSIPKHTKGTGIYIHIYNTNIALFSTFNIVHRKISGTLGKSCAFSSSIFFF